MTAGLPERVPRLLLWVGRKARGLDRDPVQRLSAQSVTGHGVHPGIDCTQTTMEYMSKEGYDRLVAELRQLELVELPRVREAIAEARDKGDLSENFEYHAAKREQGRLLGRIRFKQRVLENARVIDRSRLASDHIGLLSSVEIVNVANGARMSYTIVSAHEANMAEGKISIKSPIAQALLNRHEGDEVDVRVPAGTIRLRIERVSL